MKTLNKDDIESLQYLVDDDSNTATIPMEDFKALLQQCVPVEDRNYGWVNARVLSTPAIAKTKPEPIMPTQMELPFPLQEVGDAGK